MTYLEKIKLLRKALAPFADLLESPTELSELIELLIDPKDVAAAKEALWATEEDEK